MSSLGRSSLLPFLPITVDHLTHRSRAFGMCAGIFKQSMGARNRLGIGLSYWPSRLHRLAELILWKRSLGFITVHKIGLWTLGNPVQAFSGLMLGN
jgi:hypothetical protein